MVIHLKENLKEENLKEENQKADQEACREVALEVDLEVDLEANLKVVLEKDLKVVLEKDLEVVQNTVKHMINGFVVDIYFRQIHTFFMIPYIIIYQTIQHTSLIEMYLFQTYITVCIHTGQQFYPGYRHKFSINLIKSNCVIKSNTNGFL